MSVLIPHYGKDIPIEICKLTSSTYAKYVEDSVFDCSAIAQNSYIHEHAQDDALTTLLFVDVSRNELIAYCSFRCSGIMTLSDGDRGADVLIADEYTILSAMEIMSFALDKRYQRMPYDEEEKRNLSDMILNYILYYLNDVAHNHIGAKYIILYAVPRSKSFYERCGFVAFDADMRRDQAQYLVGCSAMYYPVVKSASSMEYNDMQR